MKTTAINIKVEPKVKREAQKAAEAIGLTLSAYVNASLQQLISSREAHFSARHTMTPYLEKIVAQAEKDFKAGDYAGPFATVDALMKHLRT